MNDHQSSNHNWIFSIKHVVFSGGAQKGNAFLGAWDVLQKLWTMSRQKQNLYEQIEGYGGSSIGALMALACSVSLSMEQIRDFFLKEGDMSELMKKLWGHIPDAYQDCGLVPSDYVRQKICLLLSLSQTIVKQFDKPVEKITMKELHDVTHINLRIVLSNLTRSRREVFDHVSEPDIPIVDAVLGSMTVPFLMKPFIYKNQCYVDGGLYDNYPVTLFPPDHLLGLRLCGKQSLPEKFNFHEYASAISTSTMTFYEEKILDLVDKEYRNRTVDIYFPPISLLELINAEYRTRESYIKLGEGSMTAFLFQNVFIHDLLGKFFANN